MDEIDKIKEAVRNLLEMIVRSGSRPSPAVMQQFALAVEHAKNRITELRNQQIPEGVEKLWTLAKGNREAFKSYLNTIPNPAMNSLLDRPVELKEIEDRLEQRITMPTGEVEDGIPEAPIQSSTVYGFAYDPKSSSLFVRFQGDGVYEYEGVPPSIFKIFQKGAIPAKTDGKNKFGRWWKSKVPSLGSGLNVLLKKGGFPYQKVA